MLQQAQCDGLPQDQYITCAQVLLVLVVVVMLVVEVWCLGSARSGPIRDT